jgi:hypothetical protein
MKGRIERSVQIARIPIIGKVKCGKKNDQGLPMSLDHFISSGVYTPMFEKEFGDTPKNIEIIFLSNSVDEVCNERLEIRTKTDDAGAGGRLFAYGDGQDFFVWATKEKKYKEISIQERPKLMDECRMRTGNDWDTVLTLRFLIPKIRGVFGVWQLTTKGEASSIPGIVSIFDKVKQIAGTVINIPFDLSIEKVKSQKPESKSVYPVIRLVPNLSAESLEKVRNYLSSGAELHGLLTDEKVEQMAPKRIEVVGYDF